MAGALRQPEPGHHVGDALAVDKSCAACRRSLGARPVFLDQVHGTHMLALQPDTKTARRRMGLSHASVHWPALMILLSCLFHFVVRPPGPHGGGGACGLAWARGCGHGGVVEQICKQFRPFALVERARAAMEIIAWLGPCIGPAAFEVGDEVRAAFVGDTAQAADAFAPLGQGKWLADLVVSPGAV